MDTPNQNQAPNPTPTPEPTQQLPKAQTNTMALISYIGPLCLIPFFTKPQDEFVKFHAKQGLVLFAAELVTFVIVTIIPILWFLGNLAGLIWIVFSVIGIMNVTKDKQEELPILGKFAGMIKI